MTRNANAARLLIILTTLASAPMGIAIGAPATKLSREEATRQCKPEYPQLVKSEMLVACIQRKMKGAVR